MQLNGVVYNIEKCLVIIHYNSTQVYLFLQVVGTKLILAKTGGEASPQRNLGLCPWHHDITVELLQPPGQTGKVHPKQCKNMYISSQFKTLSQGQTKIRNK